MSSLSKWFLAFGATSGLLAVNAGEAMAGLVLYNNFGPSNAFNTITFYSVQNNGPIASVGESFSFFTQAGQSASLDTIEIAASLLHGNGSLVGVIQADVGNMPGIVLDRFQFNVPSDTPTVVEANSTTHFILIPDTRYWLTFPVSAPDTDYGLYLNSTNARGTILQDTDGGIHRYEDQIIDAFRLNGVVVPEPNTLAMGVIGISGILGLRWLKSKLSNRIHMRHN
jgi:hypothetical protein